MTVVEAQGDDGDMFSSTRVRELLAEGDVGAAAEMLGSWWRISGVIVGGAGRGTIMGYPTANIRLDEGVTLMHGIYAVNAYLEGQKLQGAAYLGTRPTFDAGLPVLEIFLFDFDGDLYGKTMEIEFIGFIREDMKFRSMEALVAQMADDCAKAKDILNRLHDFLSALARLSGCWHWSIFSELVHIRRLRTGAARASSRNVLSLYLKKKRLAEGLKPLKSLILLGKF